VVIKSWGEKDPSKKLGKGGGGTPEKQCKKFRRKERKQSTNCGRGETKVNLVENSKKGAQMGGAETKGRFWER